MKIHNEWMNCDFEVRLAQSEDELREVYLFNPASTQATNTSFDLVLSWWRTYSSAVYLLLQQEKVVGHFTVLPLAKSAFQDLRQGRLQPQEISASAILGDRYSGLRPCWHIFNLGSTHI